MYLNDNGIVYVSEKNGIPTGEAEDDWFFLEFIGLLVEKIMMVSDSKWIIEAGIVAVYRRCKWKIEILADECNT